MNIEITLPDGRKGVLLNMKAYGTNLRMAVSIPNYETGKINQIAVEAEITCVDFQRVESTTANV